MRKTEFVYLNDKLVDIEAANISIHDLGILYGVGLFETLSCYFGKVFRLNDHLDRLYRSANDLKIHLKIERGHIEYAISELLQANELNGSARLRLTITPGNLRYHDPENDPVNTLFITSAAITAYPQELYDQGMVASLSSLRQNAGDPACCHKTLNYLGRLMALQEAQQKKCGEALWFTPANRLAQGCISNVFLVHQDTLLTPPLFTPVIPGITRKLILHLAKQIGIETRETELTLEDIRNSSEMFLTNSVMGLMPVRQFETIPIGALKPGDLYRQLSEAYRNEIERLR